MYGRNSLETQRTIYLQYIRPALEYASPSWSPWISETNMNTLQRVQNDALRAVVGSTATCPVDFLHLETNVEPVRARLAKNDQLLRERYRRLAVKDPRRRLMEKEAQIRLKTRHGWREKSRKDQEQNQYKIQQLEPPLAPWRTTGLLFDEVKLSKKKDQYTTEELKRLTEARIQEINSEVVIYTDGSTGGNQELGGAGVFIIDTRTGTETRERHAAGSICSSYAAEGVAFLKALEWLEEKNPTGSATICTDSMFLHSALSNDDRKDTEDGYARSR